MQVEFNPKDSNTFASASLDRTVKVWGLTGLLSATQWIRTSSWRVTEPGMDMEILKCPSLDQRGVNCVAYYRG